MLLLAPVRAVCHDGSMGRKFRAVLAVAGIAIAIAAPAHAQSGSQAPVELKSTAPTPQQRFDIVTPGPSTREITRVPDAEFYREDQRVPYQPALIEPFVGHTQGGSTYGASVWTSPETPVGSLASQGYRQNSGWFGFGLTFIWDSPPPPGGRHTPAR